MSTLDSSEPTVTLAAHWHPVHQYCSIVLSRHQQCPNKPYQGVSHQDVVPAIKYGLRQCLVQACSRGEAHKSIVSLLSAAMAGSIVRWTAFLGVWASTTSLLARLSLSVSIHGSTAHASTTIGLYLESPCPISFWCSCTTSHWCICFTASSRVRVALNCSRSDSALSRILTSSLSFIRSFFIPTKLHLAAKE